MRRAIVNCIHIIIASRLRATGLLVLFLALNIFESLLISNELLLKCIIFPTFIIAVHFLLKARTQKELIINGTLLLTLLSAPSLKLSFFSIFILFFFFVFFFIFFFFFILYLFFVFSFIYITFNALPGHHKPISILALTFQTLKFLLLHIKDLFSQHLNLKLIVLFHRQDGSF